MARLITALVSVSLALAGCSRAHESPGASAGEPPVVPAGAVDPRGDWRGCGAGIEIAPDGAVRAFVDRVGCTAQGSWTLSGERLRVAWDVTGTCEPWRDTVVEFEVRRERVGEVETLDLVELPEGMVWSYVTRGSLPVQRWSGSGRESELAIEGTNIFEVVGVPGEGAGMGCYWSPGDCEGILSCGGSVDAWQLDSEGLTASTSCGGDCWCRATVEGRPGAEGAIEATYASENCRRTFEGTLSLSPIALER